ncbi:hypothetical protein Vretifemale_3914 [Volvox reticuliferus]|nr:hypothetical protein Vretifemale_3914 [Volvox reticuliferus]
MQAPPRAMPRPRISLRGLSPRTSCQCGFAGAVAPRACTATAVPISGATVQILDEQAEWGRLYDTVRRHLDRHGLTRADMFLALACVRSRTFEGPHLPTPPLVKLLAGVAAAAAVAVAAAAIPTGGSIAASDPAGLLTAFLPSALAALGIPTFWQMAEARRAASAEPGTVLYAISPFIDMFNHDSRAKSECVFNPGRNEFRVAAGEPLQRAQQVLISYGNQSNDALLQRYGFVQLDGNLHDRYVVQDMLRLLERALDRYMAVPAQEVREAALALDLPTGSLDQVILTAAGPPQQAVEAVTHLLAVLAARLPNSPHGELPSAKALVSIACTEAERAAASSLQEDEAALTQLAKWEAWEEEMTALAADSLRQPFADGAAALVDAVTSEETSAQLEVKALEGVSTFAGAVDGQEIVNQEAAAVEGGRIGESDRISSVKPLPVVSRQQFLPPSELAAFGANVERYRTVLMFRIAKKRVLRSVASDR